MKPQNNIFTAILVALAWFTLSPLTHAVVPPPDGGYPGFNTAEGQNALFNLTTGSANTAVGWFSLWSNTEGSFNTATGAGALLFNTGDNNTAFGAAALLFNTTGQLNTAVGAAALLNNTEGVSNTANGYQALLSNTSGIQNTAVGTQALRNNTEGNSNTATGERALFSNTTGTVNTAGGVSALGINTEGFQNTGIGGDALGSNTTGSQNTAIGTAALFGNTTGSGNTALGFFAGDQITGEGNVCIGAGVSGVAGEFDQTWIKNINATPQDFIPGTNNYVTVRMSDGRLGYTAVVSSKRYKRDIKPMAKSSEVILALKPVTFRLNEELDPTDTPQWGLIAEDVEKVAPDLVTRNGKGQVESVRYEMVNAMLLNEFLKEHRKVKEQGCKIEQQEATIAQLKSAVAEQQKEIQAVTASLKKQVTQIRKVNAKLAAGRPYHGGLTVRKLEPRVALNDRNNLLSSQ